MANNTINFTSFIPPNFFTPLIKYPKNIAQQKKPAFGKVGWQYLNALYLARGF